MRKLRVSKLGRSLVMVFRHRKLNPISPILRLVRYLKSSPTRVSKGYLAVYVGESDDEKQRVLIPLIHLNHPQLGKLLDEAEKEYGFNHPGVINIPCTFSQFQRVHNRIATTQQCSRRHYLDTMIDLIL